MECLSHVGLYNTGNVNILIIEHFISTNNRPFMK